MLGSKNWNSKKSAKDLQNRSVPVKLICWCADKSCIFRRLSVPWTEPLEKWHWKPLRSTKKNWSQQWRSSKRNKAWAVGINGGYKGTSSRMPWILLDIFNSRLFKEVGLVANGIPFKYHLSRQSARKSTKAMTEGGYWEILGGHFFEKVHEFKLGESTLETIQYVVDSVKHFQRKIHFSRNMGDAKLSFWSEKTYQ